MPEEPRQVAPLDVDAVRTVQIGTGLWAVALVVTLLLRDELRDDGRVWWIWTCVAGVLLGLVGVVITTRRRARLAQRRESQRS
ncbi:MAG: DUF2530 domain-containing protein [Actinomycetes bacterium]